MRTSTMVAGLLWPVACFCAEQSTLKWSVELAGEIHSPPAIASDGSILLGAGASQFVRLAPGDGQELHRWTGFDSIIGAVSRVGRRAFFTEFDELVAVSLESNSVLWRRSALAHGPAAFFENRLFVLYADRIHAFDAPSGERDWSIILTNSSPILDDSPPLAAAVDLDGTIYFSLPIQRVVAMEPELGQVLWEFVPEARITASPAVDFEGRLFVADNPSLLQEIPVADGRVYALDRKTGKLLWRVRFGASFVSSPVITAEGNVLIGAMNGVVLSLNSQTGTIHWRFEADGAISSTAVIGSGSMAYVASEAGTLYALDTKTGEPLWELSLATPIKVPLVLADDGTLYVASGSKLFAVNTSSTAGYAPSPWPGFGRNATIASRLEPLPQFVRITHSSKVELEWEGPDEEYELQKSSDFQNWDSVLVTNAFGGRVRFSEEAGAAIRSYYRLKKATAE